MIVLYLIILAVFNLTDYWSYSIVRLKTKLSTTLSLFLIFTGIMTQYFSSQGGQEYLVGYKLVTALYGTHWVLYCLLLDTTESVSLLIVQYATYIYFFQEKQNSHYIYNESLQDDYLTRIACKTF